MKKRVLLAAAVSAAVLFCACGNNGGTPATTAAPETTAAAETTAAEETTTAAETTAAPAKELKELGDYEITSDGSTLTFRAYSNPTTGYSWAAASSDEKVISVTSDDFAADSSAAGKTGVGGVQTIVLTAAGEGSAQVTFAYTRSWESGNNASEIQADVTVDADKKVTFTSKEVKAMSAAQDFPEMPVFTYEGNSVITRAISDYLGQNFRTGNPGEASVPVVAVGFTDDSSSSDIKAYGGYWVYRCHLDGTTLVMDELIDLTGILHLAKADGKYQVFSIEPLDPSTMGSTSLKKLHDPEAMADIVEASNRNSDTAIAVRKTFFGIYAEAASAAGITIDSFDLGNGPEPMN